MTEDEARAEIARLTAEVEMLERMHAAQAEGQAKIARDALEHRGTAARYAEALREAKAGCERRANALAGSYVPEDERAKLAHEDDAEFIDDLIIALASQPAPVASPGIATLAEAVVDVFGDHRSRVGAVLHQERIDEVLAVANAVLSRPSQPAPVAPDTAHAPGIMPATEPLLVPNRVSLPPSEWKCSCTREERDSKCYRHPSCAECGEATTHPVEACVEHWTRNGARLQPAPVAPETRDEVPRLGFCAALTKELLTKMRPAGAHEWNVSFAVVEDFMMRARAQGRREGLEAAARVADENQGIAMRQADRSDEERDTDEARYLRGKATSARHVAVEIRALLDAPPTIADPLDAVAEIAAWRELEPHERVTAIAALTVCRAVHSDPDEFHHFDKASDLLKALAPPPVASEETT